MYAKNFFLKKAERIEEYSAGVEGFFCEKKEKKNSSSAL